MKISIFFIFLLNSFSSKINRLRNNCGRGKEGNEYYFSINLSKDAIDASDKVEENKSKLMLKELGITKFAKVQDS